MPSKPARKPLARGNISSTAPAGGFRYASTATGSGFGRRTFVSGPRAVPAMQRRRAMAPMAGRPGAARPVTARPVKMRRQAGTARMRAQRRPAEERRPVVRRPAAGQAVRARPAVRLESPQARLQSARNGLRRVAAAGYRAVKPVAEREAGRLAEFGSTALNETSATIHYGLVEGVSTAGDLTRHGIGAAFGAAKTIGKAAGSTAGNLVADGAVYGIGLADRGIRFTARTGARAARGFAVTMPKAVARRVLQYIGDRRAIGRMVNPNLRGRWNLYVQPNTVLTRDGFVQHMMWRNFKTGKGELHTMQVAVEFGFTSSGKFIPRVYPVRTGNEGVDALNQYLFRKRFRTVRRGARSLTRRLGGIKGIGEIKEMAMSAEAFPEEPYAEPPSEPVRASGPVPENAALSDAEIQGAFEQAGATRRQGAPVEG